MAKKGELWNHLAEQHDLHLLGSELRDIELIVLEENKKLNKIGWFSLGLILGLIVSSFLFEIL